MDKKAAAAARRELTRALDSIDALGASNNFDEIQTHWAAFLTAAGRIFTKLEQGAKNSLESKTWFGKKVYQRRNDPLLCYIWHARNADEHTLQDLTLNHPGKIQVVNPTPEELENFQRAMQQQPHPYTALATMEVTMPHIRLLPVKDRGVSYSPPAHCVVPFNTGMLALSMLDPLVQEAEAQAA